MHEAETVFFQKWDNKTTIPRKKVFPKPDLSLSVWRMVDLKGLILCNFC